MDAAQTVPAPLSPAQPFRAHFRELRAAFEGSPRESVGDAACDCCVCLQLDHVRVALQPFGGRCGVRGATRGPARAAVRHGVSDLLRALPGARGLHLERVQQLPGGRVFPQPAGAERVPTGRGAAAGENEALAQDLVDRGRVFVVREGVFGLPHVRHRSSHARAKVCRRGDDFCVLFRLAALSSPGHPRVLGVADPFCLD
mmetsp:Transcript_26266/g.66228  ORF Transcript_26266/g.66228 Transcript_26266/m.66228 type:complete len:200 (+) Transcript_26266:16069-16668(+)